MERDAGISHGASSFLRERLMLVSDGYQTVFCKSCGTFAVNDAATQTYKKCRLCRDDSNFGRVTIPYAYKLLIHLLASLGINLRPEFLTTAEYTEKVLQGGEKQPVGDMDDIQQQLKEADEVFADELADDVEVETDYADIYAD